MLVRRALAGCPELFGSFPSGLVSSQKRLERAGASFRADQPAPGLSGGRWSGGQRAREQGFASKATWDVRNGTELSRSCRGGRDGGIAGRARGFGGPPGGRRGLVGCSRFLFAEIEEDECDGAPVAHE